MLVDALRSGNWGPLHAISLIFGALFAIFARVVAAQQSQAWRVRCASPCRTKSFCSAMRACTSWPGRQVGSVRLWCGCQARRRVG